MKLLSAAIYKPLFVYLAKRYFNLVTGLTIMFAGFL
jgi:hypothetical protein